MPDTQPPDGIAALRAEIDALDDALHDLVMRRAEVVARLAESRAKGDGPALRPGREAAILRRLLARHAGPLPREALVRLWRELLWAHTTLQAPITVAAALPEDGVEVLRAHLGLAAAVTRCADEGAAFAAFAAGEVSLVALPAGGRWWRSLDTARLSVVARLPFLGAGPIVFLLSPAPPDSSGDDRSLACVWPGARFDAPVLARDGDAMLVELPSVLGRRDAPLGAVILGTYAAPIQA